MNATPIKSRADLDTFTRKPMKSARSWFTPDVELLQRGGEKYVLKDFSRRALPIRSTWGRFLISREVRAYRTLAGLSGVPGLVAELGRYAFVMQWIDARPLPRRRERDSVGMEYFRHLQELLDAMHARGVAHGDIRRRNVLISPERLPYIIDFESAVFKEAGVLRRLFPFLAKVDSLTVLKIRHKYFPEETSPEEERRLSEVPFLLRIGRFVRQNIYGPVSPKMMKARLERLLTRRSDPIKK